jgi:hypothetical protein
MGKKLKLYSSAPISFHLVIQHCVDNLDFAYMIFSCFTVYDSHVEELIRCFFQTFKFLDSYVIVDCNPVQYLIMHITVIYERIAH